MAYNNLANDAGSLQQFSELWESSRYSQRMSADPDSLGHMLEKTEHPLPDLSLCEMPPNRRRDIDDHRGIQRLDAQSTESSIADDSAAAKSSKELRHEEEEDKHELLPKVGTPSWLSNALMRQQPQGSVSDGNGGSGKWCSSCGVSGAHCMCRNMQTTSPSMANHPYTDWLSAVPMGSSHPDDAAAEIPGREHQGVILGLHMESGSGNEARPRNASNAGEHAHERDESMPGLPPVDRVKNWQEARLKAKLLTHPLFSQMLHAHVGCLRIATPVDQLPKIDEQLGQSQSVLEKYSVFAPEEGEDIEDKDELDDFMRNYTMILLNMQEQLQTHVRVHATEAMVGCWDIEQQLYNLTGVSSGSGNGATMSDDEDEQAAESDGGGYETGLDVQDSTGGFGPLVPTETERSLMERVRQELKLELNEASLLGCKKLFSHREAQVIVFWT
ncbi:unnamed protein product [Calypogeia fissa]